MTQKMIKDHNGKKNDFILFLLLTKITPRFLTLFPAILTTCPSYFVICSNVFNLIFSFDTIIPLKSTVQV